MDAAPLSLTKQVSDITALATNRLLQRLSMQELGVLIDAMDLVSVPAGAVVMRQGDQGVDAAYVVLDGTAVERRGALEVRTLAVGDHFGELSLASVDPRTATVQATTELRLARLSRARFVTMAKRSPELGLHVLGALAGALATDLSSMTERVGILMRERSLPRRATIKVRLTVAGQADPALRDVATSSRVGEILPREIDGARVVGALLDGRAVSLDAPLVSDARVAPLTMATWEGRDILRRSVGLLLLEAAHRVAPSVPVRLGASLTLGRVAHVDAADVDLADLGDRISRAMRAIAAEGALFREELWSVEEARAHFTAVGWTDAAALLMTTRDATVPLASCGEVYALADGPLLTSTQGLGEFSLGAHPHGLLLDFGDVVKKHVVAYTLSAERAKPRFGGDMTDEERRWLTSLGVTSVGTFNAQCVTGSVREVIRVSEGFHEKRIGRIADLVEDRKSSVRIISIAGPSSSGKTTFIKRLTTQLEIVGLRPVSISLDDYYVDRERTARDADGQYDFEALEALDLPLLGDHVRRLLTGAQVPTARFDFLLGKSHPAGGPTIALGWGDVLLLEGIHGLNPALLGDAAPADAVFRVFVHPAMGLSFDRLSAVSTADVRLLRRLVRDRHHRGYRAEETIARWPSVRRGETLHILPFQSNADVVFDTSLVYELSVLKVYADRYLLEVPAQDPAFATAFRLRKMLDRFVTIYPDHVPPTSILREFIGGSGFEY